MTGYQFTRINELLAINSNTQNGTLIVSDSYATRNEFHGGILGVLHEADCGCLNLRLLARVALGNLRRTAILRRARPMARLAASWSRSLDTTEVSDTFSAAPEFGVSLGYQFSPCMEVRAGYTLLLTGTMWSARKGSSTRSAGTARPWSSAKTTSGCRASTPA